LKRNRNLFGFLVSFSRRSVLEEENEEEEEERKGEKEDEEEKEEEGDSCGVKVPLCCRLFSWLEHS